jgi:hypothetical protein
MWTEGLSEIIRISKGHESGFSMMEFITSKKEEDRFIQFAVSQHIVLSAMS